MYSKDKHLLYLQGSNEMDLKLNVQLCWIFREETVIKIIDNYIQIYL